MATSQYVGARYVPLFAEPAQWDNTKQYEPLTIVLDHGNSYTSRQFVPVGIELTNDAFWALTGNYNAQVEQYRQEVRTYDDRITTAQTTADGAAAKAASNKDEIDAEVTRATTKEGEIQSLAETNETDIEHLDAQMAATTGSELLNRITTEATNREAADTALNGRFPVATNDIAAMAVTDAKLAAGSVTADKLAAGSVTADKLAAGSVTADKLAAGSVTNASVADDIDGVKIKDSSIGKGKLAFRTVPSYKILFCGDSYSAESYGEKSVAYQLQQILPTCEVVNVSVGGAGYNVDTRTFKNQLVNAAKQYDAKSFDFVIIAGGRNDTRGISAIAQDTFITARNLYPNARVIAVPMLWDYSPLPPNNRENASDINYAASNAGCSVLNWAWIWCKGNKTWYDTDKIHPLPTAAKVMAGYIADGIFGTYTGRYYFFQTTWGTARFEAILSGDKVSIDVSGATGGASTGYPDIFKPYYSKCCYGYINGSDSPKLFFIGGGEKGEIEIFGKPSSVGGVGLSTTYLI